MGVNLVLHLTRDTTLTSCWKKTGLVKNTFTLSALFMNLYSAVERLLMYADSAEEPGMTSSSNSIKYILFHEICPALLGIMQNGLKPEVITSFGRMQTSVWRLVEAVTNQGNTSSAGFGTSVGDLIMLLNTRFEANGEDDRKFAGFVAGLLKYD